MRPNLPSCPSRKTQIMLGSRFSIPVCTISKTDDIYIIYGSFISNCHYNCLSHPISSSLPHFCLNLSRFISCTFSIHFLQSMQNYCEKRGSYYSSSNFPMTYLPGYCDLKLNLIWLIPSFSTPACCCVLSRHWLCGTPWAVAHQAPLPMGFSRQESWSRLPWPAPGDLPDPGIKSCIGTWVLYH